MTIVNSVSSTESVVHLFHRASQVSEDLFTRLAGTHGLTSRQLVVLEIVAQNDRPSQSMVCEATGIDRSTLADIVRRLVWRGLVTRRRSREDARRYALRLTDEGRRVLEAGLPVLQDVEKHIVGDLNPGERETLVKVLRTITSRRAN